MGGGRDLGGRVRHCSLQPAAGSARAAREFVRQLCVDWRVDADVCADAELVATELVSNVVDHAGTRCEITVSHRGPWLRIEVEDFYPCSIPTSPRNDLTASRGRGLLVVAGVSAAWGVRDLPDGKSVWAVLSSV